MQLGKYEIHEEIGRGGFGTVYRATDRALGVERAVKIMHPALSQDAGFLERFRLEAHLAARLEHPHIVPVYDLDEINGVTFLAMKYLPGGSLKQRLTSRGALPFPVAAKLLTQVATALDYAHQQGLIHRDVKPANILFETDDLIRLTDFGFAKAMSEQAGSSSLTLSGGMIGTPPYIAPEIWRHKPVSPAVDQYSLACLFYECLTGQTLFAGDSPADIMTRHVLDGPEFPASWPAGVPAGLAALLEKALSRDPAGRFASCSQFAAAVSALAQQPPASSIAHPAAASQPETPALRAAEQPDQPAPQPVSQPISQPAAGPEPDPHPAIPPALAAVPPRALQASAGFSRLTEPFRRPRPWWITALLIFGSIELLAIFGLGTARILLDWMKTPTPEMIMALTPTATSEVIIYIYTPTPIPSLTPTQPINPGQARVEEVIGNGIVSYSNAGGAILPASAGTFVDLGARFMSDEKTSLKVTIGEAVGQPSIMYIFQSSDAILDFQNALAASLSQGSIFIQAGGREAQVSLPNHNNAVAYVSDGRMIVQIDGSDVWVWCFDGDCRFSYKNGDEGFSLSPGDKRVYHSIGDDKGDKEPIEKYSDIVWSWNTSCNGCILNLIYTPTPKPNTVTPTSTPTIDKGD